MRSIIRGFLLFTLVIFALGWYFDQLDAKEKARAQLEEQFRAIAESDKKAGVYYFRTPKVTIEYIVVNGEVISIDPVTKKRMPDKVSIANSRLTQ